MQPLTNKEIAELQFKKYSALHSQIGGNHYKQYAIQPIEFFIRNNVPAAESYVIKYALRHRNKGGAEDLRKAIHILEVLLEVEYGEPKNNL